MITSLRDMLVLCTLLLLVVSRSVAQDSYLSGIVVDATTNEPLPSASVFFNGTTIGVFSENDGKFQLPFDTSYTELVVSFIGYRSIVYRINPSAIPKSLRFELDPDHEMIEDINISAKRSDRWRDNLAYFTEHFIGKSTIAQKVSIANSEDIFFDVDDERFRAYARGPITIVNKELGFKIEYTLVHFELNLKSRMLTTLGYPRFIPMKGSKRKQKKWKRRRLKAYRGSLAHFLHSICNDDFSDAGFSVQKMYEVENPNYPSEKAIEWAKEARNKILSLTNDFSMVPDTVMNIISRSRKPKITRVLEKGELVDIPGFIKKDNGYLWTLDHLLSIEYNGEKADPNYAPPGHLFPPSIPPPQTSILSATVDTVLLDNTCKRLNPLDLRVEEYWAFESIAEMLPQDYLKNWFYKKEND